MYAELMLLASLLLVVALQCADTARVHGVPFQLVSAVVYWRRWLDQDHLLHTRTVISFAQPSLNVRAHALFDDSRVQISSAA
ncbi:hypothetical protein EVAR_78962_1 [Eumeta japonica]|uniref:Secreted protein n=1 Tax=Eumeta variegata TaxID=151549 RepID=A0A4C1US35_EUMVA|nr:hypothetical protein EVAR_78962_1 [Eumeta japonica]